MTITYNLHISDNHLIYVATLLEFRDYERLYNIFFQVMIQFIQKLELQNHECLIPNILGEN